MAQKYTTQFNLSHIHSFFSFQLTVIGRKMAAFPLDPRLSKCILASLDLKCSEEILTIVALLSVESIVYNPSDKREEARSIRRKFLSPEGDQITLLKIFRAHRHAKGSHEWCQEHFVNFRAMRTVLQIRKQLRDLCIKHNIPIISCGKDFTPVRRALAAGMFTNSAELQRDGAFFTIGQRQIVEIHPSSALFHTKPSYVIFNELVKTSKCYMRNICVVDPQWLVEACPRYFKQHKIQLKAVSS